jgi:Cd2+/Zn2+-exporting ATPase
MLKQAIGQTEGVKTVQLDPAQAHLFLRYDERRTNEEELRRAVSPLIERLGENLADCPVRHGGNPSSCCRSCRSIVYGPDSSSLDRSAAEQGIITLDADSVDGASSWSEAGEEAVRVLDFPVPEREAGRLPQALVGRLRVQWERLRQSLSEKPWELIFTITTFVFMVGGLLVQYTTSLEALRWTLFGVAYVTGGVFGVTAGIESLKEGKIDVDILMVLAAVGAAIVGAPFEGVLLLFLFSLSNVLQNYAMGRTRSAIRSLMTLRPARATVLRGEETEVMPVESVSVGERFLVRPGEKVSLDGVVEEGESAVDQSVITGESRPVRKQTGDEVLAGTINKNGSLTVRVTKEAKDSTIAKVIQLVEDARGQKAKTQRFLDTAEQYYAMGVIVATALAIVIPTVILGEAFGPAFYRAMTLMVAASPCALIISTPASILSAIGNGARRGVLFKGGVHLEQASRVRVVAFDKTGTLTIGKPQISDVCVTDAARRESASGEAGEAACEDRGSRQADAGSTVASDGLWYGSQEELLALVASAESRSEHILAQATMEEARRRNLQVSDAFAFEAVSGHGVRAEVESLDVRIGNLRYFDEFDSSNRADLDARVAELERQNKTVVAVGQVLSDGSMRFLGAVAFADQIREGSRQIVRDLKRQGVERVVMLTGDNTETAEAIGEELELDEVYPELLPDEKLDVIQRLEEQYGPVAMVGDGVNDAPGLARASLGIAMGAAGTDVALETADVVLMSDDLGHLPYVMELSRRTKRTLIANLGIAGSLIAIMILGIFAVALPLPLAVVGHEGGTVLVSLNGLRLLFIRGSNKRSATQGGEDAAIPAGREG